MAKTRAKIRAEEIRRLEDRRGRVTAERLVAAAADPDHPMHEDFEWDNELAGHQYRLDQARQYIAQVRVVVEHSSITVVSPGYLRDLDAHPEQGYRSTAKLQTDREAAFKSLMYELARLQALVERCREIAVGLELQDELDNSMAAIKQATGRIRGHMTQITDRRISA